jgi:hypothetical protein
MAAWGFWDWIAYLALGGTALTSGLEAGLKRLPQFRPYVPFSTAAWWGFAPLGLFLLATIIFLTRALTADVTPIVAKPPPAVVSKEDITAPAVRDNPPGPRVIEPFVMPRNLSKLPVSELRTLAYQLDTRLNNLVDTIGTARREAEEKTQSLSDKAKIKEEADWMLDYQFRRVFRDSAEDLRAEMILRIRKIGGEEPVVVSIPEKGLIDAGGILTIGVNLVSIAKQMSDY